MILIIIIVTREGYHVGWVMKVGSDYDFYNTKHDLVHSVLCTDMLQLSDDKVLLLKIFIYLFILNCLILRLWVKKKRVVV